MKMCESVRKEIKKLAKMGVPEDWLEELADIYSINDDGKKASARYIINGMDNEAENYMELMGI